MEEKKEFVSPRVEIIQFEQEDMITTSGDGGIELPDDDWEQYYEEFINRSCFGYCSVFNACWLSGKY